MLHRSCGVHAARVAVAVDLVAVLARQFDGLVPLVRLNRLPLPGTYSARVTLLGPGRSLYVHVCHRSLVSACDIRILGRSQFHHGMNSPGCFSAHHRILRIT